MATERWTDTMVDALASSVLGLRQSVGEVRDELRESLDGQRITLQALCQ